MSDEIAELVLFLVDVAIVVIALAMAGELGFVVGGIIDAIEILYG